MFQVQPDILEISKALGEETRFSIFQEIAASDTALTVKDLVATFGMHHSAIRIHLGRLEEAGLIISHKRHTKGAVGRPQLAFTPNPEAMTISLPPRNYQLMAQLALDFARREGVELERAEEFGSEWGRDYARSKQLPGRLSMKKGLDRVCDELTSMGSPADWAGEKGNGAYLLTIQNCPFRELPDEYTELVCGLHQSMAEGILGQVVDNDFTWQHVANMRTGDPCCTTHITNGAAV